MPKVHYRAVSQMTTRLVPNRDKALRIGYVANTWSRPVPYEQYAAVADGWDVQYIERDGEGIGAVYRNPTTAEVHVAILPQWRRRWVTRGLLRQILSGPRVVTRVMQGHDYMHDILHRLGFTPAGDGTLVKEQHRGL